MFKVETRIKVRYVETDQMGVVHHSNYFAWFEVARVELLEKLGFPYNRLEKEGLFLPMLSAACVYRAAAGFGDEVVVSAELKEMTGVRMDINYEVRKVGEERVITQGETVHAWANSELKPVNLKKYRPDMYDVLIKVQGFEK